MTKLIDLEKKTITIQSDTGPQRKDARISGELGIITTMAPTVDHPISYRITHVPSGAMLRFQIYHDESDACGALADLNRMRNTWDFMTKPTQREQERIARRFHEIAEEHNACVACVNWSINKNNALTKSGKQITFGGMNGYSEPEPPIFDPYK